MDDLKARRLGRLGEAGTLQQSRLCDVKGDRVKIYVDGEAGTLQQSRLCDSFMPQPVSVARGADVEADIRASKGKYDKAYHPFRRLTYKISEACEKRKAS